MTSISNIKIGKKIALVLGAIVLILAGLSGLSLWGLSANQKQAVLMIQRLTKARLAERVSGDTAAVAMNIGRMVVEKKAPQDLMDLIVERKKSRLEAIEEFKRLADTPTSIKHGADMAELVQARRPWNSLARDDSGMRSEALNRTPSCLTRYVPKPRRRLSFRTAG